jgi:hypothetical protein
VQSGRAVSRAWQAACGNVPAAAVHVACRSSRPPPPRPADGEASLPCPPRYTMVESVKWVDEVVQGEGHRGSRPVSPRVPPRGGEMGAAPLPRRAVPAPAGPLVRAAADSRAAGAVASW